MIKTYEAIFEENNKGVYSISLVEDPAMEGDFIALSKAEKIEFKAVDDEKRILVGLVLEPNKPIYRNQGGEEFNIVFSEDTVTELLYNFQKQGYQKNSSIEHSGNIDGVTFVENWQVRDENMDTALSLGLNPKKGSWVSVMKCDNDEVYQKAKSGEVKGFSVDAFLSLKEIKLNNNKQMENEQIKKGFAKLKEDLVELFSTPKKEEVIKDKVELSEEIKKEEVVAKLKEDDFNFDAFLENIKSTLVEFKKENDATLTEIKAEFKKENETLKEEIVELKKQPAVEPISTVSKQVELNSNGRILKELRQNK